MSLESAEWSYTSQWLLEIEKASCFTEWRRQDLTRRARN